MLQTVIEYKDVFSCSKQRDKVYNSLPTDGEWAEARLICEKLQLFHEITELFSGSCYPTANLLFLKIYDIKVDLIAWVSSPDEVVSTVTSRMIDKFDKYWKIFNHVMAIAAVLYPRFKMKLVSFYFKEIYRELVAFEIQKIHNMCYDILHEHQARALEGKEDDGSIITRVLIFSCSSDRLSKFDFFVNEESDSMDVKSELDICLGESVLPRCENFDILTL
ncbi:Putative AC transposase [Apostasia shenzhenica]|uniref:AC transposase n=1 Tax=Apostasia shenzhenica TaxID=1088818 RepID=A0A2I0ALF4_9ASPA|nr:Putative AC transposase [Apostasia shenzhenica]